MSVFEDFFTAWGEADPARQAQAIAEVLATNCRYADPRTPEPLFGPEAIAGYISMFTEMAPGAQAILSDHAERDGISRLTVTFRMADGMEQLGQYLGELDESGRISRLTGFVGTGTN